MQVHVKDKRKKMLGPDSIAGQALYGKAQLQLNLSVFVRRFKIPADHPAASVHAMY